MGRADDGRVVFVTGALPGELVDVELTETEEGLVARATSSPSSSRRPTGWSRCARTAAPAAAGAAGCTSSATAQLGAKAAIVAESHASDRPARRRGRSIEGDVGAVDPFGIARRPGRRRPDRHARLPRGAIERARCRSTSCPIAASALFDVLRDDQARPGCRGHVAACRRRPARSPPSGTPAQGDVKGLARHRAHRRASAALYERRRRPPVPGVGGIVLPVGAGGAELLVDAVRRAAPELDGADHVVDAYGGVGLFACRRAGDGRTHGHRVVAIVRRWTPRCNLAGRAATIVQRRGRRAGGPAVSGRRRGRRPGTHRARQAGVGALAAAGAPVLVLVSCDPVSLARDVTLLRRHGYRHERTEVLDLFPNTHHVETVTRFVADSDDDRVRAAHWHTATCSTELSDEVATALADGVAGGRPRVDDLLQPRPAVAGQRRGARPLYRRDPRRRRDPGGHRRARRRRPGRARRDGARPHPRAGAQDGRARPPGRGRPALGVRRVDGLGLGRDRRGGRASRCSPPAASAACTAGRS